MKVFNCNMELTLDIIGGKWKPIIIYYIGTNEKLRYGELKRIIPNISERMLSRALRELEKDKVINREVFEEKIMRVEYTLTDRGLEVLPILTALTLWGQNYNKEFKYATVTCR